MGRRGNAKCFHTRPGATSGPQESVSDRSACLEYWGVVRGQDQRGPTEGGRPGRRMGVVQAIEGEVRAFEGGVESQGRPEAGLGHIQPEGAGPLRQEPGSI